MIYKSTYNSPMGLITLASDGSNLIGLWLEGQKYFADKIKEEIIEKNELPVFVKVKKWLEKYFNGEKPEVDGLPLLTRGGEFRQSVWKILCEIPYGETVTYGEIAKKMANKMNIKRMSSQAVGGAVGHNPISIIIPCHRVIGYNNNLTGYAGGVALKLKLLELEGVDINKLKMPKR